MGDKMAMASTTVVPSETISKRLHNLSSVSSSQSSGDYWCAGQNLLFVHSLSCLQALQWLKLDHPLIGMVKIVFTHIDIGGSEKADLATKAALNLPHANLWIPFRDFKFQIDKCIISNRQDEGNNVEANRFCSVKPLLGDWQSSYRWSRWDKIILCRSLIDHTFLTHNSILAGAHLPECEHHQCILTVHHILVRCPHLQPVRDDDYVRVPSWT